jgi:hypothetical protein
MLLYARIYAECGRPFCASVNLIYLPWARSRTWLTLIPAEPDADIWFRAEFPFATKEMADRFCEALKLNGRCNVVPVPRRR